VPCSVTDVHDVVHRDHGGLAIDHQNRSLNVSRVLTLQIPKNESTHKSKHLKKKTDVVINAVGWSGALVDDVVVVAMVDQQHPSRAHALLKVLERFPKNKTVRIFVLIMCGRDFT
jgi:hypothetical protein